VDLNREHGDWRSPQVSAPTPVSTREPAQWARKNPNRKRLGFGYWWRRAESNRRPQVLYRQLYILSLVVWFSPQPANRQAG